MIARNLGAKYKKANLQKVMEIYCQNLTMTQHNDLLKLLLKFEDLFNGTLSTWKTYPVYFDLKEYVKPIWSRPYPVTEVYKEIFKK